jgi:thiol-disulfide isomerase/thioredoxin
MSLNSLVVAPKRFSNTLVYYFMPGCPYCQEFEPVFLQFVNKIQPEFQEVKFAAVDITKHNDVGVPVKSVPTIIFFNHQGQPVKMQANSANERSISALAKFLLAQLDDLTLSGGASLVIHITGVSGSGKSYMGNALKAKFGDRVMVVDLDKLRDQFLLEHYGQAGFTTIDFQAYQNYLHQFIAQVSQPLVFVGLNDNTRYGKEGETHLYYDLAPTHSYMIDVDARSVVKQKCLRLMQEIVADEGAMSDLVNRNEHFLDRFTWAVRHECSLASVQTDIVNLKRDYERLGYHVLPRDTVLSQVIGLLQAVV